MGLFDKFMDVMRLSPDDEDDYYDDYYEEEDDEPVRKKPAKKEKAEERAPEEEKRTKSNSKITPMRTTKRTAGSNMAVCVIKPTNFDDSREITDTLLSNRTVVLNVEGLDVDIAQRIIDFTSGSCYAMNGNLQKISNYIFIITPEAVDISGDFQNILDSFDTSGIQTDFR